MALILNLKGPAGNPGAPGDPGAHGANGATWTSGAGVPLDANGNNGDFYMNETTGDVYKKAAGTWF
jgi:hypothetical protein